MVLKSKNNRLKNSLKVQWIGIQDPPSMKIDSLSHLIYKNVLFYTKCVMGPYVLHVGDCVLVLNADAIEPDTVESCDIAKIKYLYEYQEDYGVSELNRAVVQWYSRPTAIPKRHFLNNEINVDFDTELIEEYRSYDSDIPLESIYRKCSIIYGTSNMTSHDILKNAINNLKSQCPIFVCRYKYAKVRNTYRLLPLKFDNEDNDSTNRLLRSSTRSKLLDFPEDSEKKRRRSSLVANQAIEYTLNYYEENKISPIKIINRQNVVRLSAKKLSTPSTKNKDKIEIKTTPRSISARRNLNLSLIPENESDTLSPDCLNYSVVTPDTKNQQSGNDMKMKLRVSGRKRSTPVDLLIESDILSDEIIQTKMSSIRSGQLHMNDVYRTPRKTKNDNTNITTEKRKSILKSGNTRLCENTPRRSIKLSNIVDKHIFNDNDVISTARKSKSRNIAISNEINMQFTTEYSEECTPKKSKVTPKKRSSTTKIGIEPSTPKTPKISKTPSKMKMIRSGEIQPSMKIRRSTKNNKTINTDLQIARELLHVSVVPKTLPCRENEFENIFRFLEGKIEDQCSGCMYVSGVPGTGKTATVSAVIRKLQELSTADELPPFEFLEINGMRLTEPRQAYVEIYRQLTGRTIPWEHAYNLLEKRFTTSAPRRVTTILMVDELDILCNRRQDVVYNLLDWPTKSTARLVVITIANTMDLPERLLMGKVTSRLGLTRLTFQPYTYKQLQEIVVGRLGGSDTFKDDAIQLVARKVAAVSGDARRALDICRRATEIAESGVNYIESEENTTNQLCVTMVHVQKALTEMIASSKVQAIKNCSRLQQIFLQAVAAEVTRIGIEETSFLGVYTQLETIANFMGFTTPTTGRALQICSKLGSERLIICEHSRNDLFQKILLNVSMDDIHYALKVVNEKIT